LVVAVPVQAQAVVDGPRAVVSLNAGDGTLTFAVTRGGKTVLAPAPVGIVTERADLSKGLRALGRSSRTVVESYRSTVGKKLFRRNPMTETTYRFEGVGGARLDFVVRTSADGVAYRYSLRQDTGAVLGEASTFQVPPDSVAWLAKYRRDYENPFLQTTAGGAETAEFMHPALFDVGGTYLLISESDVDGRYSGGRLVHTGGGAYRIGLWDPKVLVDGPLTTPWRTMIVGDLNTVTTSTLVDDLAPPSKVQDTSWIKPGPAVWTWIAGGRSTQQSLVKQKEFVDYAAAHGWPHVVVDAGWYDDPNWRTTSWMPELVRYAAAKRVDIHTWVRFSSVDTPAKRADFLGLLHQWGVRGLKIDFMDSDGQERYRWYDEILPETAAMHFLVNFHGAVLPHGYQRTWPHVMSVEAVNGAEKNTAITTSHLTTLPFTRNVVGSMDYTPMAFHRTVRSTTDGHELALGVLFESGVQNFAGTPASYDARPEAKWFLEQVPTAWDETKVLAGRPAESAVLARRSGDRWFIGAGISGAARTLDVPLGLSGRWLVEYVHDGATGLVRERKVLDGKDKLSVAVPADGGFAAIACRWRHGLETCAEPVHGLPRTEITASPAAAKLVPGQSFEVTGKFTNTDTTQVTGVSLAPRVPEGWSVKQRPVQAWRVRPGESVEGKWTVTVGAKPVVGLVDVPVVASFRASFDRPWARPFEVERAVLGQVSLPLGAGQKYVSDLPFTGEVNGLGPVERDVSNGEGAAGDGVTLTLGGTRYGKGIGAHAGSEVSVALGDCRSFEASVGTDDEVDGRVDRAAGVGGSVAFAVLGDGRVLAETGVRRSTDPALALTADLTGVRTLTLRVTDGGDGTSLDHASWGDARVTCAG
jgi:hypothetical protein